MEESNGWKFGLRRPHEVNKMISWGIIMNFYHFLNCTLEFWRAFTCPLHGECSLSLHVNKFWGSWIPFHIGLWRGNSYLYFDINELFWVSGWRSIQLNSHLSPYSIIPSSPFPHTLMLMAHLLEWCLRFDEDSWCQRYDVWCMAL